MTLVDGYTLHLFPFVAAAHKSPPKLQTLHVELLSHSSSVMLCFVSARNDSALAE